MTMQRRTKYIAAVSVVALAVALIGGATGAHAQSSDGTTAADPATQLAPQTPGAPRLETRQIVVEETVAKATARPVIDIEEEPKAPEVVESVKPKVPAVEESAKPKAPVDEAKQVTEKNERKGKRLEKRKTVKKREKRKTYGYGHGSPDHGYHHGHDHGYHGYGSHSSYRDGYGGWSYGGYDGYDGYGGYSDCR